MYADTLGKQWGGIIGKYAYYVTFQEGLVHMHLSHVKSIRLTAFHVDFLHF